MRKTVAILAIDDEAVILDAIDKLCASEGWKVDKALSAEEALSKIDKRSYDLLVCDIKMPDMDGFELLKALKDRDIRTPVIITTGYSTVENAVRSLYSGAIDFLPKPFTFDELISCINRGLNYAKIMARMASGYQSSSADQPIVYIPCPPKYQRLGYMSWCYLEDDGSVRIGLTDLFLRTIVTIKNIHLSSIDDEIIQGNGCCQIETEAQLTHNVLTPLSGRIIKRNEAVLENHSLCEKDPYFDGWLYRIVPDNLEYESRHLVPCSSDRL